MYFHNGDYQPKTEFNRNDCAFEEVYVFGLNPGHYLKSEIPYFYSSSNGHLSVSNQTKTFNYYDPDHKLIETIHLTFVSECEQIANPVIEQGKQEETSMQNLLLWFSVLVLAIIVLHHRRQKHAKNHIYR
jgi:hypothetical protein